MNGTQAEVYISLIQTKTDSIRNMHFTQEKKTYLQLWSDPQIELSNVTR